MRTSGRTDRQTDMTKLIVACRNFANDFKYHPSIWLEGKKKGTKVTVRRSDLRSYTRNCGPRNKGTEILTVQQPRELTDVEWVGTVDEEGDGCRILRKT
jgi:hypothetical protein